ncbi:MAG: hypothetical protein ACXU8A_13100 [Burkholderiaceae bacterium]
MPRIYVGTAGSVNEYCRACLSNFFISDLATEHWKKEPSAYRPVFIMLID